MKKETENNVAKLIGWIDQNVVPVIDARSNFADYLKFLRRTDQEAKNHIIDCQRDNKKLADEIVSLFAQSEINFFRGGVDSAVQKTEDNQRWLKGTINFILLGMIALCIAAQFVSGIENYLLLLVPISLIFFGFLMVLAFVNTIRYKKMIELREICDLAIEKEN